MGISSKHKSITSDLEVKSNGALTGAELGRSHNRWYVMEFVVKMCSHSISNELAKRIAIEIHVGGWNVKRNFKVCVDKLNSHIDRYHPTISEVL